MPEYSEQDLKHATELREEIHGCALARVRAVYPDAGHVVDEYPSEAYFQKVWDYPGQWYTVAGTPPGSGGRKELTETIVRQTLEYYREKGSVRSDSEFYRLIAEYPDTVCDYFLVNPDDQNENASDVFPYRGVDSHRHALEFAFRELSRDGKKRSCDTKKARCKKLKSAALFAPEGSDDRLNYRKAFLCPPHGNSYTDRDFERVNAALFPGGAGCLEAFRWTTDWSDYFDGGHECWGALCLTVYDRVLERFVIITASATD